MGKQLEGEFLPWPHSPEAIQSVKKKALIQLLTLLHTGTQRTNYPPYWGDEIEYAIIRLTNGGGKRHDEPEAKLALKQKEVLEKFEESPVRCGEFTAEFAKYMVEGMPGRPVGSAVEEMVGVEGSMRERRAAIQSKLPPNEHAFTISMFPLLGAPSAIVPLQTPRSSHPKPPSFPEEVVSSEARYQAANTNIPARRGAGQHMSLPKYKDKFTDSENIELDGSIYGPGHCGLQVTFQAKDLEEARWLHDQFIPLGPIMLALTAATPIYKGFLADTDTRWDQISMAVDDRSKEEKEKDESEAGLLPRWYTNTMYLSPGTPEEFQLSQLAIDNEIYNTLIKDPSFDTILSRHFAHIFMRDPIMIAKSEASPSSSTESSDPESDLNDTTCFDSLNDSIWPHVRFKIPPLNNASIGWRIEFRPMELQVTDFENAAFVVFCALLRRVISEKGLCFGMKLGKVQENMERAQRVDAVRAERFWFRRNYVDGKGGEGEMREMSVHEIINGPEDGSSPGLIPLIRGYLSAYASEATTPESRNIEEALNPYLDLISRRASGKAWTAARWMREFVRGHEEYKGNSVVSERICGEMMDRIWGFVEGRGREGCEMF